MSDRILLLGCGRCGTHWITEMMDQSSLNVLLYEVLVHVYYPYEPYDQLREEYLGYSIKEYTKSSFIPDHTMNKLRSIDFLKYVYDRYDVCKIQDYQWDLLNDDVKFWIRDNCKIIHLYRTDCVARYISSRHAYETHSWYNEEENLIPTKITVNKDLFDGFVKKCKRLQKQIDYYYPNRFYVTYEELMEDTQKKMNELFDFVGVDRVTIHETRVKKALTRPFEEFVINYEDLLEDK